jgi:hypothetical protein
MAAPLLLASAAAVAQVLQVASLPETCANFSQHITPEDRQACPGMPVPFKGINPTQCAALGCCFNSTTPRVPWCFAVPSPISPNITITNKQLKWLGFFGQPDPAGSSYDPTVQSTFANLGHTSDFKTLEEGAHRGMTGLFRSQQYLVYDSHSHLHLHAMGAGKARPMQMHGGMLSEATAVDHAWTGKRLFPDYRKRWTDLVKVLQPWVSNGTIRGFHIGDELVWGGLPYR